MCRWREGSPSSLKNVCKQRGHVKLLGTTGSQFPIDLSQIQMPFDVLRFTCTIAAALVLKVDMQKQHWFVSVAQATLSTKM